jgi:lipopolysaccharide/colanic/teichoic acid biosynthesis glycosyltransferase
VRKKRSLYLAFGKRALDVACSALLLLLTSPLLVLTALLLFFANHGQVLFRQERPGLQGKLFRILKFKTMSDQRSASGELLPDSARLTTIGRFIRRTSLDELLQLVNVLRGEMSLVGPRPLLPEYLPLYSEFQAKRHDVLPGITGLAQVSGRNLLSWEEKFKLDVEYVKQVSFLLDIKILAQTAVQLLRPRGVSAQGEATMPRFEGTSFEGTRPPELGGH